MIAGGPTVFCAGTDIAEGSGTLTDRGGEYGIIRRRSTTPIIAAVEGSARRRLEIALACHLIAASSTATFDRLRYGVVATSAGLFRVPRALPLNVAREMLRTGDPVSAQRLADLGVVNRVAEPGRPSPRPSRPRNGSTQCADIDPRHAHGTDAISEDDDAAGWAATEADEHDLTSEDREEGLLLFERRPPGWPGR